MPGSSLGVGVSETAEPDAAEETSKPGFGTFAGVFVPTLLTILGVIMFVRLGWVVGNAGLLGATAIILIAFVIVGATALSLSSITTNIRIGAGGAYSIISQSLGIEVGGSIGLPLYISQALAVSMYVFGFREGWLTLFPGHPAILVDLAVFGVLFAIALVSAELAFKIQYAILAIIIGALGSVAAAAVTGSMTEPITLIGSFPGAPEDGFPGTSFWPVFAVFFPAATGIMAGANMSGELEDPRKSIPRGTLAAIAVSLVIYLGLAFWLARSANPVDLVTNYTIMLDLAYFEPLVLAGLLAATFSSALVSLVGAPRILQALAVHRVMPRSDWFAERTAGGEPRNAMLLTGLLVLGALMLRDLNAVAPVITMFFLITYMMLNVIILVEQQLELVSFRPLMRIPSWVPLVGTGGCVLAIFVINPLVGLAAVVLVGGVYAYLTRKTLDAPFGDVRSGLFASVAEWAATHVGHLGGRDDRAWKPKLLVPVAEPRQLHGEYMFLRAIAHPTGSVTLIGIAEPGEDEAMEPAMISVREAFRDDDVYASATVLDSPAFEEGVIDAMQSLRAAFFRPNILYLSLARHADGIPELVEAGRRNRLGSVIVSDHDDAGLGRRQRINLWIPDRGRTWALGNDLADLDLAVLVAIQIHRTWQGQLRLLGTVDDPESADFARSYLDSVANLARLPLTEEPRLFESDLETALADAPEADLTVIPLPDDVDPERLRELVEMAGTSCVFVRDGGGENALA